MTGSRFPTTTTGDALTVMFSNGKWNYVLRPGSPAKRDVRAVRADGKEIPRDEMRTRRSRAA